MPASVDIFCQLRLNSLPELKVDDGSMFSYIGVAFVWYFPQVDSVVENFVERTSGVGGATRLTLGAAHPDLASDSFLVEALFELPDTARFEIEAKHLAHLRCFLLVDNQLTFLE